MVLGDIPGRPGEEEAQARRKDAVHAVFARSPAQKANACRQPARPQQDHTRVYKVEMPPAVVHQRAGQYREQERHKPAQAGGGQGKSDGVTQGGGALLPHAAEHAELPHRRQRRHVQGQCDQHHPHKIVARQGIDRMLKAHAAKQHHPRPAREAGRVDQQIAQILHRTAPQRGGQQGIEPRKKRDGCGRYARHPAIPAPLCRHQHHRAQPHQSPHKKAHNLGVGGHGARQRKQRAAQKARLLEETQPQPQRAQKQRQQHHVLAVVVPLGKKTRTQVEKQHAAAGNRTAEFGLAAEAVHGGHAQHEP